MEFLNLLERYGNAILYMVVLPLLIYVSNTHLLQRFSELIGCEFADTEYCQVFKRVFGCRLVILSLAIGLLYPIRLSLELNFKNQWGVTEAAQAILAIIALSVGCQYAFRLIRWLIEKKRCSHRSLRVILMVILLNISGIAVLTLCIRILIRALVQ